MVSSLRSLPARPPAAAPPPSERLGEVLVRPASSEMCGEVLVRPVEETFFEDEPRPGREDPLKSTLTLGCPPWSRTTVELL